MMYLYFDKNGDIKSISPTPDSHLEESFSPSTFMLSEVEDFLTGKKNPSDYQVKKATNLAGEGFKLLRKVVTVTHTRTMDNYLTKVEGKKKGSAPLVKITNDVERKVVSVEVTKEFLAMTTSDDEDEEEIVNDFLLNGISTVYITRKNNPYAHMLTITFLPSHLFEKVKLYFPYTETYTNTSAYTKKLLDGYSYREKGQNDI